MDLHIKGLSEPSVKLGTNKSDIFNGDCFSVLHVPVFLFADSIRTTQQGEEEECNNNEPVLSTAESHPSTFGLCLSDQVLTRDVLYSPHGHQDQTSSGKDVMNNISDLTLDSGERTPTTCHELLPSSGEDEDVDVLEVSSSASEPLHVPPVLLRLSTEEEEDTVEDVDVDILGVESD